MNPVNQAAEIYLRDWAITLAMGGLVCLLLGLCVGWMIWRNTSREVEKIETGNRQAFSDFERASDDASKIRAEIFDSPAETDTEY